MFSEVLSTLLKNKQGSSRKRVVEGRLFQAEQTSHTKAQRRKKRWYPLELEKHSTVRTKMTGRNSSTVNKSESLQSSTGQSKERVWPLNGEPN